MQLQGWYNWLQRDEVVAEWKKVQGKMSLHVHCHISGGHFLLDLCANLRYFIFRRELPVVISLSFSQLPIVKSIIAIVNKFLPMGELFALCQVYLSNRKTGCSIETCPIF